MHLRLLAKADVITEKEQKKNKFKGRKKKGRKKK
jgi:hypothetical protein